MVPALLIKRSRTFGEDYVTMLGGKGGKSRRGSNRECITLRREMGGNGSAVGGER